MDKYKIPAVGLLLILTGSIALAENWPQFLGPRGDGTSKETGLIDSWGQKGPPVLWKKEIGEGYSGPVIAGDKLIVFHRRDKREIVACWNAKTGKEVWTSSYPCDYEDGYGKGDGPRSTPVISGEAVFTLGADGWLHGWSLKDGKKLWGHDLKKSYQIPPNFFGIGTSPIAADGKLLVNVGGKNAGIVAFDTTSGKEVWKATDDGASYSSPALARLNGKERAVFFTRFGVAILNPKDGAVVHRQQWRARYAASVNAATPLVIGDILFFSASYETGALVLQAKDGRFKEVWKKDEVMSNHYNTCIYHNGYLYGIHGRQEVSPALRCIELNSGKVQWTQENFGCASMILADGKIIALTEGGELVLFEPNGAKYREISRAAVFANSPCRAQIALSDGRLYARDRTHVVCFDLKKQ